jgi:hypothetical protein
MIQVHYPPEKPDARLGLKVFLAGTIDMGNSRDWQQEVIEYIETTHDKECTIHIFNPRRKDWNSSWEQKESNYHFRKQVEWELDRLEDSHVIIMGLMEDSKSPISLLELGAYKHKRMMVYCPDDFYRSGNVQIFTRRNGIRMYNNWDTFLTNLRFLVGGMSMILK